MSREVSMNKDILGASSLSSSLLVVLLLAVGGCLAAAEEGPDGDATGGVGDGSGGVAGSGGSAATGGTGGNAGTGGIAGCGSAAACDDGDPCTNNVCDLVAGTCDNPALPDGARCVDGNSPGKCMEGICVGVCTDINCDDGNPCTSDACDALSGVCINARLAESTSCDAGGDAGMCSDGVCLGICDAMLVDCDDGNQCTEDLCEDTTGDCSNRPRPNGAECRLGGFPGRCVSGVCVDAQLCRLVVCSDGNDCTEDVCNELDASCSYPNKADGAECAAGNDPGRCRSGVCQGLCEGVDCDDDNPCTSDICDPSNGSCPNPDKDDGTRCVDGDQPGKCSGGLCVGICADIDCDDGDPCTIDACDEVSGACTNSKATEGTGCEVDGIPGLCLSDVCVGLCDGIVDCSDGEECTEDRCEPTDGTCSNPNLPDDAECDFGGFPGRCSSGLCVDAELCRTVDCSDDNDCTDDICNRLDASCTNPPKGDGTDCEVGGDPGRCSAGTCRGLCEDQDCDDGNPCTVDTCDPSNGSCPNPDVPDGTACNDGGNPGECTAGLCVGLCVGVLCDDGNECTDDICDPATGNCTYPDVADDTECDSGSGVCESGTCVPQP